MTKSDNPPAGPVVIAVSSIKGGVGKTSTSVNLANAAAEAGLSTLVWDLDPQGAATWSLDVGARVPGGGRRLVTSGEPLASVATTEVENLSLLPADFSLRHLDLELHEAGKPRKRIRRVLKDLRSGFDVVVIDCPPGISLAIEAVLQNVDAVLVPVVPEGLALRTVDQLRAYASAESRLEQAAVLPFLSLVDRRRPNHRRFLEDEANANGLLETMIPVSVDVERISVERRPTALFARRSRAVTAYRQLWQEVLERIGERALLTP